MTWCLRVLVCKEFEKSLYLFHVQWKNVIGFFLFLSLLPAFVGLVYSASHIQADWLTMTGSHVDSNSDHFLLMQEDLSMPSLVSRIFPFKALDGSCQSNQVRWISKYLFWNLSRGLEVFVSNVLKLASKKKHKKAFRDWIQYLWFNLTQCWVIIWS